MTVNVGTMQLPVPEDPDAVRPYLNGTHVSGGLWTALTRSSNHDHSGGTNGIQLTATSIPDGSITTAKLDPAVLGPYALTDGSKPFTGTVTMSADTLVRDTLRFGAKPAGVADATLSRTGPGALRADSHLGVGVNPEPYQAGWSVLRLGQGASLRTTNGPYVDLTNNTYIPFGGTNDTALVTGAASRVRQDPTGAILLQNAPSVAAGAAQTFTTRMALAQTGTLTLTPDAGQAALMAGGPVASGGHLQLQAGAGANVQLTAPGGYMYPTTDNAVASGHSGQRWTTVYAVAGAINTSSRTVKEGITPLDPAACYQAAKDVVWYSFSYLPPAYQEPPEQEGEDAETREARLDESRAAHAKMLVETAPARNQRGFVFPAGASGKDEAGGTLPPVPELFGLSDRESTTPQADLATLGAALQEVIRRLEAVEAQP